jgi:hypothetical protein
VESISFKRFQHNFKILNSEMHLMLLKFNVRF